MLRVLVDANVLDAIIDGPGLLTAARRLHDGRDVELLLADRQRLEVARTPDGRRRRALQSVPVRVIPTAGVLAAGHEDDPAVRGEVAHPPDVEDALLAATAVGWDLPLVTRDRRLAERAAEVGVEVWTWEELRRVLGSVAGREVGDHGV